MESQHQIVVYGRGECIWMAKLLDHFGPEQFAVGEKFCQKGLGGSLFLFLLDQVYPYHKSCSCRFCKTFQIIRECFDHI